MEQSPTIQGSVGCKCGAQTFFLLPQRALWWPAEQALVVSDLHIDKAAHFRKSGIPLPGQGVEADLQRLDRLFGQLPVRRLVITGDLFHSKANKESAVFLRWCDRLVDVHVDLVLGNHDRFQSDGIKHMTTHDRLTLGEVVFVHDPLNSEGAFHIGGHHHPGLRISDGKRDSVRMPCFVQHQNYLILPAFGRLTGLSLFRPSPGLKLFGIANGEAVIPLF